MSDLLERMENEWLALSSESFDSASAGVAANVCQEAMDEIKRLQSQLAEARKIAMEELADHFGGSNMGDPWTGKQIAEHIRDRIED